MSSAAVLSVSELTSSLRGLLELHFRFVAVSGEISNLHQAGSGHSYFVLKDKGAQLRAVLFRNQQRYLAQPLADGQMVVCRGRLSVYEQRGEYQLLVDTVEAAGTGALHLAFAQLKARLAAEGLFDQGRKRPLPLLPDSLVLVTSPQGAVVHDFLRIARRRCPVTRIAVYPVPVQGAAAAADIAAAVADINRRWPCDLLVVCRGGGSIEDLWAFNEEVLARAIAASRIPVVSAVGHEVDITISDYVADLRAPTPSAAAELVLPDVGALRRGLQQTRQTMVRRIMERLERRSLLLAGARRRLGEMRHVLDRLALHLDHLHANLARTQQEGLRQRAGRLADLQGQLEHRHPLARLQGAEHTLATLETRLERAMQQGLQRRAVGLGHLSGTLSALSPLATLARGYAIVQGSGGVVTDSRQTAPGERLRVRLHQGSLGCEVREVIVPQGPSPASPVQPRRN
ncbi:MAG: exodeoxyribonuclease VII large subunit [Desulfobulbaceae bacterium A2]|nr:MAG: exodeoxyribonuclease VII large subunit [Desulfobulbaceae bacterium A2]